MTFNNKRLISIHSQVEVKDNKEPENELLPCQRHKTRYRTKSQERPKQKILKGTHTKKKKLNNSKRKKEEERMSETFASV